jgi:peroxiredoxin Q/BCP
MFSWFNLFGQKREEPLKEGDPAPDFTLLDQDGKTHRLSQYRGRYVILYFYPKDQTPGCTREACSFRDHYTQFQKEKVVILGVSTDSVASHKKFSEAYQLPFPLLADTTKEVCRRYGTLSSLGWANRHTFVIDPEGRIIKVYRKVNPETHAEEVEAFLRSLQKQD